MKWWLIVLVVGGFAAAGAVGYALGGSSREDDVDAAEAKAEKAQQTLAQEQAQDEQAVEALKNGLVQLGGAIAQQDEQDAEATQAAIDQAADEVRAGLEQVGKEARADVERAVSDLSERINDAVSGSGAQATPDGGG